MSTILIATANDNNDSLHTLEAEGKEIQRILNSSLRKNYDIVLLPHATTEDIIKELNVTNCTIKFSTFNKTAYIKVKQNEKINEQHL